MNKEDIGLNSKDSMFINGNPVNSILPGLYPENNWVNVIIKFSCSTNCPNCQIKDSFFIVSDDIISFNIGGELTNEYNICSNAGSNLTITANFTPGAFNCTTCIGNSTPFFFTMDPLGTGPGSHMITYNTIAHDCPVSSAAIIHVLSPRVAQIIEPFTDSICAYNQTITCDFKPPGGTYKLNDQPLPGDTFNASLIPSQIDNFTIEYSSIDDQGCIVDTMKIYNLLQLPDVVFVPLESTYCQNDAPVTLFGIPSLGSFTLENGSSFGNNILDFSLISPGYHELTYLATDGYCSNQSTQDFTVKLVPNVIIYNPDTNICSNGVPVDIITNRHDGNFFPTVYSSGIIDPSISNIGSHHIVYSVTENDCTGSDEMIFSIVPPPIIILKDPIYSCEPYTLTMFNFSTSITEVNSTWQFPDGLILDNQTNFTHDFQSSGQKDVTLTVTNDFGCISKSPFVVFVPAVNESYIHLSDSIAETHDSIMFSSGSTTPLISTLWLFGDGAISSDSMTYHSYQKEGVYNILLSTIDKYGCSDTATARTLIKDPLDIHFQVTNLYPNPVRDILEGEFYTPISSSIWVTVFSMDGKLCNTYSLQEGEPFSAGKGRFKIPIGYLPPGMYVLSFSSSTDILNGPYYYDKGELIYEKLDHLAYLKFIKL